MSISQSEAVETEVKQSDETTGSTAKAAFRQLRRSPTAIVGLVLIVIFVLVAVFAPLLIITSIAFHQGSWLG